MKRLVASGMSFVPLTRKPMKRQRGQQGEMDIVNISLRDVYHFLQNVDLSCDELVGLEKEVGRLYATKAHTGVVQNFPVDMWVAVFEQVPQHKIKTEIDFYFWLNARTVCKTWHSSISKMDWSFFVPYIEHRKLKINPSHMLQLFYFSNIWLVSEAVDVDLLTKVKSLRVGYDCIAEAQIPQFTKLTQLTELCLKHCAFHPNILASLTNLEALVVTQDFDFEDEKSIDSLYQLTNLETLVLGGYEVKLDQATLMQKLTKLTDIRVKDNRFYKSGFGSCYFPDDQKQVYHGEWKDGKSHGHGLCFWRRSKHKYVGDWVDDRMHGKGIYMFPDEGYFQGEFENNTWKSGERYFPGDHDDDEDAEVYKGQFDPMRIKHGTGTYEFQNDDVYEGEWANDYITGQGKCTFSNGDTYEGGFYRGARVGKGKGFQSTKFPVQPGTQIDPLISSRPTFHKIPFFHHPSKIFLP